MQFLITKARRFLVLLCFSAVMGQVIAATITSNGTGGGNWSVGGSWAGGIVPLATDHVVIAAGDQINLNTNQTCVNATIHGTLNMSNGNRTLTVNGSLTFNGTGAITSNGATRTVNVANNLVVNAGATASISGITFSVTGLSTITGSLTFTNNTGSRTLTGDVTVTGSMQFSANVTLGLGARLSAGNGSIIGGGGGTGTITAANNLSVPIAASTSLGSIVLTCGGISNIQGNATLTGGTFNFATLQVIGNGVLNASGGANTLNISGNWNNTSAAADPFVQGSCTVTLNGSTGTQQINNATGLETFHNLVIANTSATSPGLVTSTDITVANSLDQSNGAFDLDGHTLTISGSSAGQTHAFTGGSLISSSSGADLIVNDPSNVDRITFSNHRIGSSAMGVTATVTCGRISFVGFTQWGTATFTKTLNVDDVFGGGNHYHGPVTFNAASSASRWRMGDNLAQPDTFVNATFNANALSGSNNNFIICANSLGNAFYGTTRMTSTTVGGFFVCRSNGTGTSNATFHGPVIARVTFTGNITFADAAAGYPNSVTFNNTVQSQSSANSTGDIYYGAGAFSTITVSPMGQFVPGTVQGQTSIHFRNVTQTGTLQQSLMGISNSRVFCGAATYPNIFNGPVDLQADTLQVSHTTFNGTVDLRGFSHLTFAYSNFNDSPNTFIKQGVGNSSSTGGNTFIAGSTNTVSSFGSGYMRLAATQPDDVNGNIQFVQSGSGALVPAYGASCTFSGDISTIGTITAIQFGVGGGTVVLDGNGQHILGEAVQPPLFYRLTAAHTGTLTMNVPATVRTLLTMTSGAIDLGGNTFTIGISTAIPGTLAYTSGWFHGGPLTRWFGTAAVTLGNVGGLFPLGHSTTDYRPLWFGSTSNLTAGGTITAQHTPTASGHVNALHADASWGNMVVGVSNAAWPVSTGNGLAVNGTTARLRYGGTGFAPFVLTDLNATQPTSVIGTFAAASSVAVPLEVGRTGLNTVALSRIWHIGSKDNNQSPLPVELLYFNATPHAGVVLLTWATASEHDNDHFLVERSADTHNWSVVGQYAGAGNSAQTLTYTEEDRSPLPGTSHYRLKQVDADGSFTCSAVSTVHFGDASGILISPNPTSGLFRLTGVDPAVPLSLFDMHGRAIAPIPGMASGGSTTLDASGLPPGPYLLCAGGSMVRLIVER